MLILREYRRMGKQAEYTALKKRMVDALTSDKWDILATQILKEDRNFINEYVDKDATGMAFEMELEEIATNSMTDPKIRSEKFKYFFVK